MARILIVDRDVQEAQRLAQMLTNAGHACELETSGAEGLRRSEDDAFDLLILDAMLPDISGFEVCRQVRRKSSLFHLPIVFCSAMGNPEEVRHGLDQGADDFLTKPINLNDAVRRIETLLANNAQNEHVDAVTRLADSEGMRRRIQAQITRGDSFGLVYVELLGVRRLTRSAGKEARDKVFRHLARALTLCGETFTKEEFFAGHMGGGFFVALLPSESTEGFCAKLQRSWRKHLQSLYESLNVSAPASTGPTDFLDLMMCVTMRAANEPATTKDLLDTLTRIRRSVGDEVGGIHLDRRVVASRVKA